MHVNVALGHDEVHKLDLCLRREWLETDGLGGYASSTVLLCPTRRYHGLLVAPVPGLARRHSFLSRFEETIHGGEREFPLSMARYPEVWSPKGHLALEEFGLTPFPSSLYRFGGMTVTREILMVRGAPVVLARYRALEAPPGVFLRLRPLLTFREADALTFANLDLDPRVKRVQGGIVARPYEALPRLAITVDGERAPFEADPVWYYRVEYQRDLARGYEGHEDQFSPGYFEIPLRSDAEIVVAAALGGPPKEELRALWAGERDRRRKSAAGAEGVRGLLSLTADDYLFQHPDGRPAVTAGFPWFGEWGRDSFLALPGLTLARGRVETCGEALEEVLRWMRRGRLPNVFGPSTEESDYPAADTGLWFARAVELYAGAGGSPRRVREVLAPAVEEVLRACLEGREDGPACDEAGLLRTDPSGRCLTWMDARVDGVPVTPRTGSAVEVNALWYAALAWAERFRRAAGDGRASRDWAALRRRAGTAFLERFWLEPEGWLADSWADGIPDRSVRPNMLVPAALEWSPLDRARRLAVVERVEADLLTPVGVRTLSPKHPDYCGRYGGDPVTRDRAYHQGTVWPWLLGFYVEACLRARGRARAEVARLRALLEGLEPEIHRHGLGHLSEVHDGDPPHRPGGAPAQAWSSAEVLRAFALLDGGKR